MRTRAVLLASLHRVAILLGRAAMTRFIRGNYSLYFVVCSNTQAGMNRIILFGNGFDLAHDLPTSYKDFINHYRSNGKIHAEQLDFPTTHSREICAFLKIAVNRICQYIHTGQHNDASDKDTCLSTNQTLHFGSLPHCRNIYNEYIDLYLYKLLCRMLLIYHPRC